MDCGYENWKAQGSKSIQQDLTVIIFELRVDCGLIPEKPEGSLAKRLAEMVRFNLDRWIRTGRLRLDSQSGGVRTNNDPRIWIQRTASKLKQI
jgi:hypothetical protein